MQGQTLCWKVIASGLESSFREARDGDRSPVVCNEREICAQAPIRNCMIPSMYDTKITSLLPPAVVTQSGKNYDNSVSRLKVDPRRVGGSLHFPLGSTSAQIAGGVQRTPVHKAIVQLTTIKETGS